MGSKDTSSDIPICCQKWYEWNLDCYTWNNR